MNELHNRDRGINVQGLVSPDDDDDAIAALVAAVQHETLDRDLLLGFRTSKVPSMQHESSYSCITL